MGNDFLFPRCGVRGCLALSLNLRYNYVKTPLKIRQGTFREVQFPPLSILPWSPHQKETIVFAYGFKKKQWQNKLKAKTRIFLSFPAHEALCYKHSLWVAVFTELHPGDDSVSGQRSSSFHFAKGSTADPLWMCRSSFRLTPK